MPPIKGLIETSFLDWPGRVSAVVFLGGCNFRCPFCHNHELVLCPQKLPGKSIGEVLQILKPSADWLDGVVVSGGEPTIHPDLKDLCWAVKDFGLPVKVDTNGSRPGVLADLIDSGLIAAVSMDLKAPLNAPERHARLSGVRADLAAIARSIDLLLTSGLPVEFRTTVVPGLIGEGELAAIGREIPGAGTWKLNAFRPQTCLDPEFMKLPALDRAELARLQGLVDARLAG